MKREPDAELAGALLFVELILVGGDVVLVGTVDVGVEVGVAVVGTAVVVLGGNGVDVGTGGAVVVVLVVVVPEAVVVLGGEVVLLIDVMLAAMIRGREKESATRS